MASSFDLLDVPISKPGRTTFAYSDLDDVLVVLNSLTIDDYGVTTAEVDLAIGEVK